MGVRSVPRCVEQQQQHRVAVEKTYEGRPIHQGEVQMAIKNQTGQDSAVFYNNKDFKNSTIYAFHLLPDQLDRICEKLGGEAGAEILDSISPIFDFAPKALRHRISTASTSLAPAAKAPCRRPMFANGCLMHSAPTPTPCSSSRYEM